MGDFNGKIGRANVNRSKISSIGPHALKNVHTNDNGRRLIELASRYNLKIAGTFFKKKHKRKWTWRSPDKKTMNEIDHLLANDVTIIRDVTPLNRVEFSSDHRLVRGKIEIESRARYYNNKNSHQRMKTVIPMYNIDRANEYVIEKFNARNGDTISDAQQMYDISELTLSEACEIYGKQKRKENTDDKISEHTNLIAKREELRNASKINKTKKIELSILNRLVRRGIKQDIRKYEEEITKEITEESAQKGSNE